MLVSPNYADECLIPLTDVQRIHADFHVATAQTIKASLTTFRNALKLFRYLGEYERWVVYTSLTHWGLPDSFADWIAWRVPNFIVRRIAPVMEEVE